MLAIRATVRCCQSTIRPQRKGMCYVRVNTRASEPALWDRVRRYQTEFPEHTVIADIGSGYDYRRSGLIKLMRHVMDDEVSEVVISDRDQLSTTTHNHLQRVMEWHGTALRVVNFFEDEVGKDDDD